MKCYPGLDRFLALYNPADLRHPSALGTLLAACTVTSAITGLLKCLHVACHIQIGLRVYAVNQMSQNRQLLSRGVDQIAFFDQGSLRSGQIDSYGC